jgi:hypothetical protein
MMTNSVVPIPNEARARANKGRRLAETVVLGARGMTSLQQDDGLRLDGLMKRHTSIYAVLLPQALPSELKIVEGPAGTIKLPFRKLNSIFWEQLGEQSDTETLRLDRKRHLHEGLLPRGLLSHVDQLTFALAR